MLTASGMLVLILLVPLAWLAYAYLRELRGERIPILCYHRFIRRKDAQSGAVSDTEMNWVCYSESFRDQMAYLALAGYTTLDLDDLTEIRAGGRPRPARPIVITMDDGYRSNYTLAYPVLRERDFKAVIYVALEPDLHTRRQVEGIDAFLSPAELREMAQGGISIQSHTLTHAILTELTDEKVRFELQESRRRLEDLLGKSVDHFCFPRGGVDARVRSRVREAGYRSAAGARQGSFGTSSRLDDLPRINIDRDMSLEDFKRALEPRHAAVIHLVGEMKDLARRLLGPRRLRSLRDVLHRSPTRAFWSSKGLRRAAGAALGVYAVVSVVVACALLGRI